jgi:hypothetical protein
VVQLPVVQPPAVFCEIGSCRSLLADSIIARSRKPGSWCGGHSLVTGTYELGLPRTLGDVYAAARYDLDQALVGEYPDGLARGQPRDLVQLHELGLGRYRAPGRYLAALDLPAQDRGYLQVDRRLALMINRHVVKLPG